MIKGVSPVVAIVLLIAIAVISAVGVWVFVGPLTSKPPLPGGVSYEISVEGCVVPNLLDIKNTGASKIVSQTFSLVNLADGSVQTATCPITNLAPYDSTQCTTTGTTLVSGVTYALRAANYPEAQFTC